MGEMQRDGAELFAPGVLASAGEGEMSRRGKQVLLEEVPGGVQSREKAGEGRCLPAGHPSLAAPPRVRRERRVRLPDPRPSRSGPCACCMGPPAASLARREKRPCPRETDVRSAVR